MGRFLDQDSILSAPLRWIDRMVSVRLHSLAVAVLECAGMTALSLGRDMSRLQSGVMPPHSKWGRLDLGI